MLFSGSAGSFLVGFASGFFTREIVEIGKKNLGPFFEKAGKTSSQMIEKGKESLAQIQENFEDLVAEFRANSPSEAKATPTPPSTKQKKAAGTEAKAKQKAKPSKSTRQLSSEGAL
jgi:hypothetical protein